MSETTLTPSTSNYKYYYRPDGVWGTGTTTYIGSRNEASSPGDRFAYFPLSGASLISLQGTVASITSITLRVTTTTSSSGYNGCRTCFDYVGTSHTADNNHKDGASLSTKVWRLGGESGSVYLKEGITNQYTVTDSATLSNFKTLIDNAVSGTNYWFRAAMIANLSTDTGQQAGVYINGASAACFTFTIVYSDNTTTSIKCYIDTGTGSDSGWAPVTGYYIDTGTGSDSGWARATECYVYSGGWK